MMRCAALIPAAGMSSRMGSFKPLAEINGEIMIHRVLKLFSHLDRDNVLVVGGNRAWMLAAVLKNENCRFILNTDYKNGMFSSIQAGAKALMNRCDAFFVLPCDVPFVKRETLDMITEKFIESDADVCIPSYRMRGGHPPLLSSRTIPGICEYDGTDGMRGFVRNSGLKIIYADTSDGAVLKDLDTPEDIAAYMNGSKVKQSL